MHVIQLNEDLVGFAVGKLAHYVPVLVVRLLAGGSLLAAAVLALLVLVHEVIFVVGIITTNVDVAERIGECFRRRSFEIL